MKKRSFLTWSLLAICTMLFLFSVIMAGTYAWQSKQKACSNVYGSADPKIPVELVVLEKLQDGTETQNPIPDTVFYLYQEDGTQIGTRYVTDEDGKVNLSLPAGKYYFEEVSPSIGYTYDTDTNGAAIKKYYFEVTADSVPVTVTAYNKRMTGGLMIRKTVENADGSPLTDAQRSTAFTFTVTFSDNAAYPYRIDYGEEQLLASGGSLELCTGQTAIFENLPVGLLYDIIEDPVGGYTLESTGHRANITENNSAVANFVNTYGLEPMGSLRVSKEVQGADADPDKEFTFVAVIGGMTEVFTLKHGETKEFTDIPLGTEYTVAEQEAASDGYTASVQSYTGQIAGAEEICLPFVNIYNPVPPADQTGRLVITKTVSGGDMNTVSGGDMAPDKVFTFEAVTVSGGDILGRYEFTLKDGETYSIEDIPHGADYTVRETDAAGYIPVTEVITGQIIGNETSVASFINTVPEEPEPPVKLTLRIILGGELVQSDSERQFQMTLTVNGETRTIMLKANEILEFEVPYGAEYSISEVNYFLDGFSQTVINGSGMAMEELTEIVIINTYVGKPRLEIRGEKTWDLNGCDGEVTLPESITVFLKNGDTLVEETIVTPDADNRWRYTFVVPKYNDDDSEAVYTVEEAPVKNFRPTYDDQYNILNTYIKPIEVEMPVITKVVQGEHAPLTQFDFVFNGQHGTPMPENAVAFRKEIVIDGAGNAEIGKITFDKAGTYVYTVHEKNGGQENWTYDTAVYTISVVVTETGYVLSSETTVTKQNIVTTDMVFTNTYDATDNNTVWISGKKTWDHKGNPQAKHPAAIIVYVYADGVLIAQRQVTGTENWKYSFELPRYDNDHDEIVYTVGEADIEDYEVQIDGYNLKNTYIGTPVTPPDKPDTPVTPPDKPKPDDPKPDEPEYDEPDEPDKPDDSKPATPPATGDNSAFGFWLIMMSLSLIGIVIILLLAGKEKKAQDRKRRDK